MNLAPILSTQKTRTDVKTDRKLTQLPFQTRGKIEKDIVHLGGVPKVRVHSVPRPLVDALTQHVEDVSERSSRAGCRRGCLLAGFPAQIRAA